jgi:two-component system CheB/CheR fusion protein
VDDDPDAREIFGQMLAAEGAEVAVAEDGAAALHQSQRAGPFDVILCDLLMPGLDGFGFLRAFSLTPAGARVPVIAVTALSTMDDILRTLGAGFRGHLTKPVTADGLVAAIRRALPES